MLPFIRCSDVADSILLSCRAAAEAWEAAFVELARTQLASMAVNAGLRLSFSSERSVADELARESYADVSTVRSCLNSALGISTLTSSRQCQRGRHCPKALCVFSEVGVWGYT